MISWRTAISCVTGLLRRRGPRKDISVSSASSVSSVSKLLKRCNMKFKARVWKFGDNINTDLILPNVAFYLPAQEQIAYIFRANRPGWVDLVKPGDILLGGKNFGMGSSR